MFQIPACQYYCFPSTCSKHFRSCDIASTLYFINTLNTRHHLVIAGPKDCRNKDFLHFEVGLDICERGDSFVNMLFFLIIFLSFIDILTNFYRQAQTRRLYSTKPLGGYFAG